MELGPEVDQNELLRQHNVLAQFGELALQSADLDDTLTEACRLVGKALGTDLAKVVELQADGRTLIVRAGVGWSDGVVGIATIDATGETSEGYALKTGEPMISPDIAKETRFQYAPFLIENGARAVANVIIIGGEGRPPFGILQVDSRVPRDFTAADIAFLRGYANLLAATVDRFRVLDELRRDSARLQFLLEEQVAQRTASLQESNDQLDAFVYTVSHDLRAPLRAMEGFARILLDDFSERLGAEGQRYASRVVGAAKRMELLIDDLLTFSRVQRSELAPQTLDTASIVEGAVNEVQQATVDQRRVSIVVIPPLPSVQGDRTIFRQIIINLLANAVKFHDSAEPVQVVVRAEQNGRRVRLWVEDNGIGIAPQHQERIFNVFERLHGQEAYPGTGIGLAIVKAGIARMGGTCGVVSALGHGSRFWIELAHLDNVSVSTCNQGPV